MRSESFYYFIDISLFVSNLLNAEVSYFTLVGELDAEFTKRETFFNVLQEMLSNFFKRVATPSFQRDLYGLT